MNKKKKIILLLVLLLLPSLVYMLLSTAKHNIDRLPIVGERYVDENGDTIYHTIPDFSFTNHLGNPFSSKEIEGKIVVVDYFFATCEGICPKMSSQMTVVQERTKKMKDFLILSHTVNPEHDSVQVLYEYAKEYGAIDGRWHFLTGDKKELYDLARYGYLIPAGEGDGGPEDFIHSEQFVLIDKQKRIRGFYDGTNSADVKKLIDDIKAVKAEEFISYKDKKK